MVDHILGDIDEHIVSVIRIHTLSRAKTHALKKPMKKSVSSIFKNEKSKIKHSFITEIDATTGINPKSLINLVKTAQLKGDFENNYEIEEDLKIMNSPKSEDNNDISIYQRQKTVLPTSGNNIPKKENVQKKFSNEELVIKKEEKEVKGGKEEKKIQKKFPPLSNEVIEVFSKVDKLPFVDSDWIKKHGIYLKCKKKYNRDKTLYLDLDGTLIHKMEDKVDYSKKLIYNDCIKNIKVKESNESILIDMKIIIRPHAINFIKQLSEYYELVIFTTGGANYASEIVNLLDPCSVYISEILSRGSCILINKKLVKDVSIIKNREAHKSIIVDNSVMCFISCLNNGIYIKTFDGSCNDNELKPLFTFLEKIKDAKDVSEEIRNEFNLEERYHEYKKKRKKKARKYDD